MKNWKNRLIKIFIKYFDYILLLLIVIIFLGSFFGYFAPKLKEIKNIQDVKFVEGEEIYKNDLGYFEKLKFFYKEYESVTKQDIEKINAALPIGPNFSELFAGMESLFKNSDFELKSITLVSSKMLENKEQKITSIKTIRMNLVIEGVHGYLNYKKMFSILENNLPIIDIKSVVYQNGDIYSLELITYYMIEEGQD